MWTQCDCTSLTRTIGLRQTVKDTFSVDHSASLRSAAARFHEEISAASEEADLDFYSLTTDLHDMQSSRDEWSEAVTNEISAYRASFLSADRKKADKLERSLRDARVYLEAARQINSSIGLGEPLTVVVRKRVNADDSGRVWVSESPEAQERQAKLSRYRNSDWDESGNHAYEYRSYFVSDYRAYAECRPDLPEYEADSAVDKLLLSALEDESASMGQK